MVGLTPKSFFWKERWRVETDYRNKLSPEEKGFLARFNLDFMKGVTTKDAHTWLALTGKSPEETVQGGEARAELAWCLREKKNLHKAIRLLRREK